MDEKKIEEFLTYEFLLRTAHVPVDAKIDFLLAYLGATGAHLSETEIIECMNAAEECMYLEAADFGTNEKTVEEKLWI